MNTENLSEKERLLFFRELYENAKNKYSDSLEAYERHYAQYRGSDEIDGSAERACMVRNVTYEMIESQISSDIPMPKVAPASYSEHRERNARSIERLLSSIRDRLPFEEMNDLDERYTYIYGGSVWYAEWDNTERCGREVGGVRIYCLPPRSFIPQPNITEIEDMDYCFLNFTTTESELIEKYGVSTASLTLAETDGDTDGKGDATVTVTVAFYKDKNGEIGKFVFSGELSLSDSECAYSRKVRICQICSEPEGECTCKEKKIKLRNQTHESIYKKMVLSDGGIIPEFSPVIEGGIPKKDKDGFLIKRTELPYYTPKRFPIVIRRNTSADGKLFGQSDCEYIRPEQQAINKIESRVLMKLLRAGITPIVPEDATVSVNNSVFGQVIRMKPGESMAQYGKVDTTPDISQDIIAAERLYDHSKRILGISDALQGLDTLKNESGYARELRISQASGRLQSKKKMKHTAYAALDRIIFELYLAFADEPRALVYKDAYGRIHNSGFNRYDFVEYDTESGEFFYDDAYLFSIDQNGGAEYQREALWERNLENLKAGTLGDPSSNITLLRYWQAQERAHYPYARENVEYFSLAVKDEGADFAEHGEDKEKADETAKGGDKW